MEHHYHQVTNSICKPSRTHEVIALSFQAGGILEVLRQDLFQASQLSTIPTPFSKHHVWQVGRKSSLEATA